MEQIYRNAQWIWAKNSLDIDDYAEFVDSFETSRNNVKIRISCDTVYAIYLNGKLLKFMICSDFPDDKFYDEIDVPITNAHNEIKINVWHYGFDFHTAIKGTHGVIYEVFDGNNILCFSNSKTKSRIMSEFKNGYCKQITKQQGFSFYFDNTALNNAFFDSEIVDIKCAFSKRELHDIVLLERPKIQITKRDDSYLIDLGKETAGIPDLDFDSDSEQEIVVVYGEHLRKENNVLRSWGSNDFSFEFKAKIGRNTLLNPLKRLAGRFLQIYTKDPIKINYIGLRPVTYKRELIPHVYDDQLINRINEICLNTLDCCMHEHYEDCPWREQSLYTLDMRNQMLCGYSTVKGFEYQRHNLLLNTKGLNRFGLISLCVPSNIELPIPSFSLHYIIAIKEYIENTGDMSIVPIVESAAKTIMKTMLERIDETGLIHYFPKPYWNFYEWTEESHNNDDIPLHCPVKDQYDLIINALLVYVIPIYNKLFNENIEIESKKEAIKKYFYDEERGVFLLSTKSRKYSQLGNALAYSIGLGDEKLLDKIINDPDMITISLSMKGFLYEPLLKAGEKYQKYIIDDIKKVYGMMLDDNATSCYEAAMSVSGLGVDVSLCHGWSALPVYYFDKLLSKK